MPQQRHRLDQLLVSNGLVRTRSQAESWIKLGKILVDGAVVTKSGTFVRDDAQLKLVAEETYVSRAGLKLASVAHLLGLDFADKLVLDVGSSTGGFTDYALQHDARKVIAVDVGTDQLHSSLRDNPRIELHEQTDIRSLKQLDETPDLVLIDVSFISLREILPYVSTLIDGHTYIVAMAKPQFETGAAMKHGGVIKNDNVRRKILKELEVWFRKSFLIAKKADSDIAGAHGNKERFYLLQNIKQS